MLYHNFLVIFISPRGVKFNHIFKKLDFLIQLNFHFRYILLNFKYLFNEMLSFHQTYFCTFLSYNFRLADIYVCTWKQTYQSMIDNRKQNIRDIKAAMACFLTFSELIDLDYLLCLVEMFQIENFHLLPCLQALLLSVLSLLLFLVSAFVFFFLLVI